MCIQKLLSRSFPWCILCFPRIFMSASWTHSRLFSSLDPCSAPRACLDTRPNHSVDCTITARREGGERRRRCNNDKPCKAASVQVKFKITVCGYRVYNHIHLFTNMWFTLSHEFKFLKENRLTRLYWHTLAENQRHYSEHGPPWFSFCCVFSVT